MSEHPHSHFAEQGIPLERLEQVRTDWVNHRDLIWLDLLDTSLPAGIVKEALRRDVKKSDMEVFKEPRDFESQAQCFIEELRATKARLIALPTGRTFEDSIDTFIGEVENDIKSFVKN